MSIGTAFGGFAIVVLLVVGAYYGATECVARAERRTARDRLWRAAALRLGGTYDVAAQAIQLTAVDRPAKLREEEDSEGDPLLLVDVDFRGEPIAFLKVAPRHLGHVIARWFGATCVQTGDRDFDSRFVVESVPESLAEQIFARSGLSERIRRVLCRASVLAVDLGPQRLIIRASGSPITKERLIELAEVSILLTEVLLGRKIPAQVFETAAFDLRQAGCLVCRGRMTGRVIYCKRCSTPCHEECWRFARRCSVFGCNEEGYLERGGHCLPKSA